MAEIGTCRNDPCGQTDLLPYDGYCSESCRDQDQEQPSPTSRQETGTVADHQGTPPAGTC
jgi:hypothetical protein